MGAKFLLTHPAVMTRSHAHSIVTLERNARIIMVILFTPEVQMGQAKKRMDKLRKDYLQEVEMLSRPPSEDESIIVSALIGLPTVKVVRPSKEILAYMRMKPRQCHVNCRFYADNDPEKKSRWTLGWMTFGDQKAWTCHSVIAIDGRYMCLTPQDNPYTPDEFDFIVDPLLSIQEDGKIFRDGMAVRSTCVIRAEPESFARMHASFKDDLLSGMHPNEALNRFNSRMRVQNRAA
jgi:hypothetical protein